MADPKVKFDIEANAVGGQGIADMSASLRAMSDVLEGPLKTQALLAADALDQLGKKRTAIDNFVDLKSKAQEAGAKLQSLQGDAQALARTIAESSAPTRRQSGDLEKLRDAVRLAKTEFTQTTRAVDVARATLGGYGIASTNVAAASRQITASVSDQRRALGVVAAEYKKVSEAAQSSATAQAQAQTVATKGIADVGAQLATLRTIASAYYGTLGAISAFKGLSETADEFKNLQARVKLATGEGDLFVKSFDEIVQISTRTNSELALTGNLFAKLTDAGKSAGLSTQQAVEQALGLTETINQAVQLSGGSAQASSAAITQLIQGLQSGVLRGEEFNSVMEQAPRLSRALAQGLGVTTGELRKMAEAGQLSADVVIASLQGQAGALQSEFATLPETVGRAITNLSTNWTLYIAEVDKANGISTTVARAIKGLSENLDFLGSALYAAGKAAIAFQALKLAQNFIGIGTAATAAATQIGATSAAITAAGAASTTAAAGVGRFASLLGSLKTLTLVGLVTNLGTIGTAIGEGIAKLQGYKDKTAELAATDRMLAQQAKETTAALAAKRAAADAAAAAQFGLTKGSRALVDEFAKLTKGGDSAAVAIGKIGKDFDASSVTGILEMGAALDKLVTDGKIGAADFGAAWSGAIKGIDLATFEVNARTAFAGSAREAERMAQVIDVTLRESVRRAGLDFDVISGGMGRASKSAINDTQALIDNLSTLSAKGVDVGQALSASLSKGISAADSGAAISTIRGQIEQLRGVLGAKVVDGLLAQADQQARSIADALDKATPGITSLREAMGALGLTSREELQSIADKSKEAFGIVMQAGQQEGESYVAWQARKQAAAEAYIKRQIDAAGGVATEAIKAEAAMLGLSDAGARAGESISTAMHGARLAIADTGNAAAATAEQLAALDAINAKYGQSAADRAGRYDGPAYGSVLTKDKLQAVDNSGLESLRTKRQTGALTADDLATAQAVFDAARTNLDVYDKSPGTFSGAGAASITAVYQEAKAILDAVRATTLAAAGGNAAGAQAGQDGGQKTVTVTVNLNGKTSTIRTDDAGSKELLDILKRAKLAAGG